MLTIAFCESLNELIIFFFLLDSFDLTISNLLVLYFLHFGFPRDSIFQSPDPFTQTSDNSGFTVRFWVVFLVIYTTLFYFYGFYCFVCNKTNLCFVLRVLLSVNKQTNKKCVNACEIINIIISFENCSLNVGLSHHKPYITCA